MKNTAESAIAREMLISIFDILIEQNEKNWINGITAAISELSNDDQTLNDMGYDNARSIYNTMTNGNGSFSEYYISKSNELERIKINKKLDELKKNLWDSFNSGPFYNCL